MDEGDNCMRFFLRHTVRCAVLGLSAMSYRAVAEPEIQTVNYANQESGQFRDLFSVEWGLLIGIVMLALVIIARTSNHPD